MDFHLASGTVSLCWCAARGSEWLALEQRRESQTGPQGSLAPIAFVTTAVSTWPYTIVFLLSSPPLAAKSRIP